MNKKLILIIFGLIFLSGFVSSELLVYNDTLTSNSDGRWYGDFITNNCYSFNSTGLTLSGANCISSGSNGRTMSRNLTLLSNVNEITEIRWISRHYGPSGSYGLGIEVGNKTFTANMDSGANFNLYNASDTGNSTSLAVSPNIYVYNILKLNSTSKDARFWFLVNGISYSQIDTSQSSNLSLNNSDYTKSNQFIFNFLVDKRFANATFEQLLVYGNPVFNFNVTLNSPAINTLTSNGTLLLNSTSNFNLPTDNSGFVNTTYYVWYRNTTFYSKTTTSITGNTSNQTVFNLTGLYPQNYLWNVQTCGANSTLTLCYFADSNFTFNVSLSLISNTFNSNIQETASETFITNVTVPEGTVISTANLIWNLTNYVGSASQINSTAYSLSRTINIPAGNGTKSWYWNIIYSNGFQENTSSNSQTVGALGIDDCTTNNFTIINYTIYDEDARTLINNNTFNTSANVLTKLTRDSTGETFVFYANNTRKNPFRICAASSLLANQTYRLDSEVQFSASNYVTETHYIQNLSISNSTIPINVSLYNLLITRSQEFLITFKDSNFIPVEGALVELNRQYLSIGQFLPVEIMKTDSDGRSTGHFVLNDEIYNIYVRKNGQLLATFQNVKAFCSNIATGDCRLNLNALSSSTRISDFQSFQGITFTQSYNKTTRLYSVNFATNDGSVKTVNLTIKKYDAYLNTTICSNTITASSSSSSPSCTISVAYQNITAIAKIYVNGVEASSNIFQIAPIGGIGSGLKPARYLLAFLLIVTIPLIAITSGPMTLLFFIVGLIFAGGLVLVDLGGFIGAASAFVWIVIAAGILIWKANQEKE